LTISWSLFNADSRQLTLGLLTSSLQAALIPPELEPPDEELLELLEDELEEEELLLDDELEEEELLLEELELEDELLEDELELEELLTTAPTEHQAEVVKEFVGNKDV